MTNANYYEYLDTTSEGLRNLLETAVETVQEYIDVSGKVTVDNVWEIADGLVPVYNFDLLQLAAQDLTLGYLPEDYSDLKTDNVYDIIRRSVHYELDHALYAYCEANLNGKFEA